MYIRIQHCLTLLVSAAAVLLAGCQTTTTSTAASLDNTVAASLGAAPLLRQDAFSSIYEITAAADGVGVLVATINDFDKQNAGFVHRLDPRTLQSLQTVQLPRRSFALGLNNATNTLYVGNTLEGSLSVVNATSGMHEGQIQLALPKKNDKGEETFAHTRKVIVDETHNRVFVTSPSRPGLIWIVDGASNSLTHTIVSEGIWTAGAAYDAAANILYVSQGGKDEILAIDPDAGKVVRAFSTGDSADNTAEGSKHFFINLAFDAKGQRMFATDANTNRLYVLDIVSGQFVQQVDIGGLGLLDVAYNPVRAAIYTTSRGVSREAPNGTGFVTVIDANTYTIKRRIDLPVHPNSLALSPDGKTLYVTVKAPHDDSHPAWRKDGKDSVVRIDLH